MYYAATQLKTLAQQQHNNTKHEFSGQQKNDQTKYVDRDANS